MDVTLTVTEAARNLVELVHRACDHHEVTTLLENGRPVARIVPPTGVAKTGKEIAADMAATQRPRLTAEEAEAFEADLRTPRRATPSRSQS